MNHLRALAHAGVPGPHRSGANAPMICGCCSVDFRYPRRQRLQMQPLDGE
jgi:hypothetical protein